MYVTYDKEIDYNYLTSDNNARISSFSSQCKGCAASNIICNDKKSIWLSDGVTPQYVVVDYGGLTKKPRYCFKYFGIYCWHAYSTNPKRVELYFSKDNKNFESIGSYDVALKPGTQFFEIKNFKQLENRQYRYLKFLVKEAYGGNRTYVNQIYLFDDLSGMNNNSTSHTNKISTQYSENRRNIQKSESESILNNDKSKNDSILEEEEESVRYFDQERSQLNNRLNDDLKFYCKNRVDYLDKDLEKKRNMFEEKIRNKTHKNKIYTNRNNYPNQDSEEFPVKLKKEDKINRKSENVTIQYNSKLDEEEYQKKSDEERLDSLDDDVKDEKNKIFSKRYSPEKNKYFYQQFRKNSNSDYANKNHLSNKDYLKNNEYKILENQIKDMEEHLNSMQADIHLQSFKTDKYNHSRSFSYLNPLQESKINPFLDFYNFKSLNKTSDKQYVSDVNIKQTMSNEYTKEDYKNNKTLNNVNEADIKPDMEKKIKNIENKISNFEKEITDLKQNFEMLMNNINRLIECSGNTQTMQQPNQQLFTNYQNQNYTQNTSHFKNPSNLSSYINNQNNNLPLNNPGDQMNQNEMMSFILKECQNMINDKFNPNQTQTSNYNFTNNLGLNRSRIQSMGKFDFIRSDEKDTEILETSFEKSKIKN